MNFLKLTNKETTGKNNNLKLEREKNSVSKKVFEALAFGNKKTFFYLVLFLTLSGSFFINQKIQNSQKIFFEDILEKQDENYSNIWGIENLEIIDGTLKVSYPKGSYKPSILPRGGVGFLNKLEKPNEELQFSYEIKFDKFFDFVKGGKLPGLCGGSCPRGGKYNGDGFSTRFMWRSDGNLELYLYGAGNNEIYGKSIGRGCFKFEKDKFYKVSQKIKLNSLDNSDGEITIFVDGKKVYSEKNLCFRKEESTKIDTILFSTFFGGNDESWATPDDTFITMKNFEINF